MSVVIMKPGSVKLQRLVEWRKNHLSSPFNMTPPHFTCSPGLEYVAFSATLMLLWNHASLASNEMLPAAVLICSVLLRNCWKSSFVIPSGGSSTCGNRSGSSSLWLVGIGVEGRRNTVGFVLALPLLGVLKVVTLFLEEDLDGKQDLSFMLELR